jgi:hypothetical protein
MKFAITASPKMEDHESLALSHRRSLLKVRNTRGETVSFVLVMSGYQIKIIEEK